MMDFVSNAVAAGAISMAAIVVISIVLWILMAVARWRMFTKMGEPGWKAFIPVYSLYVLFCRCWSKKAGRNLIIDLIVYAVFQIGVYFAGDSSIATVLSIGEIVAGIYMIYLTVRSNICVAKAFGHGTGFGIGLWLLPHIFTLILGFGSSAYTGSAVAENN